MKKYYPGNSSAENITIQNDDESLQSVAADAASSNLSIDLSSSSNSSKSPVAPPGDLPLQDMFPCLHPVNPHMRTDAARLQTFLNNSSTWPAHRIRATPQQIIDAGMYYLGERDRVKCWYCNGGLQNWERDDNPWEEHAKWFPLCEYVLQQKGPDYVHEIVARFPGLKRPNFYELTDCNSIEALREVLRSPCNTPPDSPGPVIVDPQKEVHEIDAQVRREMDSSEFVRDAKIMGFSDVLIRAALTKRYEDMDEPFPDFTSLVDAILQTPDDDGTSAVNVSACNTEAKNLTPEEELKELVESRRCKICFWEDVRVVFLPCGHLACCAECSEKTEICPICKILIEEKIQTNPNTGKTF